MATLAANKKRVFELDGYQDHPAIASDIIFEGSAVGDNGSGYARPLQAGDPFLGFSAGKVDNSAGSAGDKDVTVKYHGLVELSVSGAAITDVGEPVFASDDDTFVLTQGSNSHIGRVVRFVSSGVVIVAFDARKAGVGGREAELTDSSGGTADGTVAAISGSGADSEINNNFAELTTKMNFILRQLGN